MPVNTVSRTASQRHAILGMKLDYISSNDFMDVLIEDCKAGRTGYACSTDVNQCMLVNENKEFRDEVVNVADYVITDSFYLNLTRRLLYRVPRLELITAGVMMPALCERAAAEGIPIALIGGRDDAVLNALCDNLSSKQPELQIAYRYSPPFRPLSAEEDETVIRQIRASGARLVFVGLGCPKQERWMAAHKDSVHAMMIGLGAAFDFNAGVVKSSPPWVHRFGLEWLHRLTREPKRLWKRYLVVAPRFVFLVMTGRGK